MIAFVFISSHLIDDAGGVDGVVPEAKRKAGNVVIGPTGRKTTMTPPTETKPNAARATNNKLEIIIRGPAAIHVVSQLFFG